VSREKGNAHSKYVIQILKTILYSITRIYMLRRKNNGVKGVNIQTKIAHLNNTIEKEKRK